MAKWNASVGLQLSIGKEKTRKKQENFYRLGDGERIK